MRWEQHLEESWGWTLASIRAEREASGEDGPVDHREGAQIEDATDEFLARILLGDAGLAVASVSLGGSESWSLHVGACPKLRSKPSTRPLYQHLREMLMVESATCSCVIHEIGQIGLIEERMNHGNESWGRVRELLIGLGEARLCPSNNDVALMESSHLDHRGESELEWERKLLSESDHWRQSTVSQVLESVTVWALGELCSIAAAGPEVAAAREAREGRAAWVVALRLEGRHLTAVEEQFRGELVCALESLLFRTETATWVLASEELAQYVSGTSARWPGLRLGRALTLSEQSAVSALRLLINDGVGVERAVAAAVAATVERV